MFTDASIMVIVDKDNSFEIHRLEMDKKTQNAINKCFSDAYDKFVDGKEKVEFDGKYKPETDEILYIEKFAIDQQIINAIEKPVSIPTFVPNAIESKNIRAIFVGKEHQGEKIILFQRFRKEQYISTKGFNLFFDKNTFVEEKRFGISISNVIDCIYQGEELLFESYFMARQIFDLREYYRTATDADLMVFTKTQTIDFEDSGLFIEQSDSTIRRLVASIMDSKVLERYSAKQIKQKGKEIGIEIITEKKKLVLPKEKKKMKVVLGFLDNGVYRGIFSEALFMTNSKKVIN